MREVHHLRAGEVLGGGRMRLIRKRTPSFMRAPDFLRKRAGWVETLGNRVCVVARRGP